MAASSEFPVMGRLAEQAFRRHYGEVYRFLLHRTSDPCEAEELTQRVFADVAAAEGELEHDERPILPWLLAVAHRRWVDERRRRRRDRDTLEAVRHAPSSPAPDDELAQVLRLGLARLPGEQRDVVIRRLWRGRSFREIAREMGLSEGAVKMRFRRGLESLRQSVREQGYAP